MTETTKPKTETSQNNFWPAVVDILGESLSDQTLRVWISPIQFLALEGKKLNLEVPDRFYGDWLKDHYEEDIISAVEKAIGERKEICFHVAPKKSTVSKTESSTASVSTSINSLPKQKSFHKNLTLNNRYHFDNFVVGPGNRFAHAAAMAVSESPAKAYNPLFIYGPVGLGKTHLLQSIAYATLEKTPEANVTFISSEKFTNELINAIQKRSTQSFREKYRNVDMLLIDDIHFLANKEATQEEFFHTFNTLYDAHKQIVVTSDRPPKDISSLEERLVSRFEWGLVTDIQPPDFETRIAILRKKLENNPVSVPDDVIEFIASKIKSNIRELEGSLIRVMAYSSLTESPLSIKLSEEVLKASLIEEEQKVNIDKVQKIVAEHFNISVNDMRIKRRTKAIAYPRQVAMFLVRQLTEHSLPEIGEYFGGRDHTTVLHGITKISEESKQKEELKRTLDYLVNKIKNG